MHIDRRRLDATHEAFTDWLCGQGEESFTTFGNCQALQKEEIEYKRKIRAAARRELKLDEWPELAPGSGEIIGRTQQALQGSENLLQNVIEQYGSDQRAVVAFFQPGEHLTDLEGRLKDLMTADPKAPGEPFDALCKLLRGVKGFGCQWAPMAYLLFLLDEDYFPVHSGRFQSLLDFYEIEKPFAGKVTWSRYQMLLDVAEELREYLALPDRPDGVEIPSYMYIIASPERLQMAEASLQDKPKERSFDRELNHRKRRAAY